MNESERSKDVVDPIWGDDLLDRKEGADVIVRFTTGRVAERIKQGRDGCYVLNIDGAWGSGKTFFLDRLRKQLEAAGDTVVHVNAWEDDHASDPLIPIIAGIDKEMKKEFPYKHKLAKLREQVKISGLKTGVALAKHAALAAGRIAVGRAVDEIGPALDEVGEEIKKAARDAGGSIEKLIDGYAEAQLKAFEKAMLYLTYPVFETIFDLNGGEYVYSFRSALSQRGSGLYLG